MAYAAGRFSPPLTRWYDLQQQRNDLNNEINRIDTAIAALSGLGRGRRGSRGGRRNLSPAARGRIAAVQRARWKKWKTAHER